MSFFKDFKEDFSQAVNELLPEGEENEGLSVDEGMDSLNEKEDNLQSQLDKLDGLLADVKEPESNIVIQEKETSRENIMGLGQDFDIQPMDTQTNETTDENAIITKGMTLTGNLESTGSVEVQGTIKGDVQCNGKLVVTGTIDGNTASAEFFADHAKVEGEIVAGGTVKVGTGSVIIGNITATSAVIAGAIKGDIDVKGPVIVDTSAVVMGNIKSKSVQINNGAVIEGFCSQCYADVDVQSIFG